MYSIVYPMFDIKFGLDNHSKCDFKNCIVGESTSPHINQST